MMIFLEIKLQTFQLIYLENWSRKFNIGKYFEKKYWFQVKLLKLISNSFTVQ